MAATPPSAHATADAVLLKRIKTVHASSRQTYGAPRVHADLRGRGERHSRKRIARLMREAGLVGASHRHGGPTTTRRNKDDRLIAGVGLCPKAGSLRQRSSAVAAVR